VDDNVASRIVRSLSRARETVLAELGSRDEELEPRPVCVIVFGSFARGEAHAESDLDVVFVRPEAVGDDDHRWEGAIEGWRQFARRLTGNRVEILEASESDVRRLLRSRRTLWTDIGRDGVVVYGMSLDGLRGRRSA
jgi:predicted nucleotidyltransferase